MESVYMIEHPGDNADSPRLRLGAAAAMLGVSKDTLKTMCLYGEVPYYLLGSNRKRFRPSDISAYLEVNRRPGKVLP